ncbi:MAG: hypothetical protein QHH05_03285 [Syntrophomonadaceae bacterium]|nr:hypothetical protein [Syntrophomonadaceae bacterium]
MDSLESRLGRIIVVTGSFGSGKSEFSLNLALRLAAGAPAASAREVALVDLDIVNPYFRTREARALLESHGVRAVVPPGDLAYADLPIYGPGVAALIRNPAVRLVLDVGGDEMGATALGGLAPDLEGFDYDGIMVVNPYRPFTRTARAIAAMAAGIQERSRLALRWLESNPNLGPHTTLDVVRRGHAVVVEAARLLGLPVLGLTVRRRFLDEWQVDLATELQVPVMPLEIYLSPPWLEQTLD